MNKLLPLLAFSALLLVPLVAQDAFAATVTDANAIPEPSTTLDFSEFAGVFNCPGTGAVGPNQFCNSNGSPIQVGGFVGEDIEWTATPGSVIGNAGYGLGSNGAWNSGRDGFTGTNFEGNTMRFTFNGGPLCGVGGIFNYNPNQISDAFITAYDSGNAVLEVFNVKADAPISTPSEINAGEFRGFVRNTNDIAAIEFSGAWDVFDDMKFSRSCTAVGGELLPIDTTALMLAGLQSSTIWMLPVLASAAGVGTLFIKSRMNKE